MRYCGSSVLVLMTVGLAACGGGGASGGSGSSGGGSTGSFSGIDFDVDFTQSATPASFETVEYFRSGALAAINASSIYSVGGTGEGQLVAVVDTGIDTDHPQLINRIDPASTNIVTGIPADVEDGSYHGTLVSGLIAAERDGSTLHGIAFDADILAIRTDTPGSCATVCSFSQANLAAATDYAVAQGADVINFSLGGASSLTSNYRQALADAVDADAVLVLAAGNDGDANPTYPGRFAAEAAADGKAIVVGAVDATNTIAGFSNRAGTAQNAYLVAPGVSLESTFPGGGNAVASGTSMAAPIVSGAVATLLDAAPSLTPEQVVQLLLLTATDLGDPGIDAIYGNGLLNLDQAIQPQGTVVLPDSDQVSSGIPVALSGMSFGGALGGVSFAENEVMVLDGFQRPYYRQLGDFAAQAPNRLDLDSVVAHRDETVSQFKLGSDKSQLTATNAESNDRQLTLDHQFDAGIGFSAFLDNRGELGEFGRGPQTDLIGLQEMRHGHSAFATAGVSLRSTIEGYEVSLTAAGDSDQSQSGSTAMLAAEVRSSVGEASEAGIRIGQLSQNGTLLGAQGKGAFAMDNWRATDFAEFSLTSEVTETGTLHLGASLGRTAGERASAERPLAIDEFLSTGWSVAWQERQVWGQDRLTLALSQPLRAENPSYNSYLPVARTLDGQVERERRQDQFKGQGREIDLELAYRRELEQGRQLGFNLMLRHEPGHVADADTEIVGIATYRLPF